MTRQAKKPWSPVATTDEDYRRAGLVPPTAAELAVFSKPVPGGHPAKAEDPVSTIIDKAITLGFEQLANFLKTWLTPATPVHGGSRPIYAHTGELIKLWIYNPDDYVTIMINDKMVGGASIGQEVEVVADKAKEGLNLIVGKLENSGGFEWGIDMAARRDGHDWESDVHVGDNEGPFKTTHLILFQVYGQ